LLYNQVTLGVQKGPSKDVDYTVRPYRVPKVLLEEVRLGWLEFEEPQSLQEIV